MNRPDEVADGRQGGSAGTARLTVASFNTRGMSMFRSALAQRYRAIAEHFEASSTDVVNFQEVLSYYHLRGLARYMPSFRWVSYGRSLAGPAGGVVTMSRLRIASRRYHRFPRPAGKLPGLPSLTRLLAPFKGFLVTRLAQPDLAVVNVHPIANKDGDWSVTNRFHPLHRQQLTAVTRTVRSLDVPLAVCGDFNVTRDSDLYRDFRGDARLVDAFDGRCPPTFHAEYLPAGRVPQCIDFILTGGRVQAGQTTTLFAERVALPDGPAFVSDHIGLQADLIVSGADHR